MLPSPRLHRAIAPSPRVARSLKKRRRRQPRPRRVKKAEKRKATKRIPIMLSGCNVKSARSGASSHRIFRLRTFPKFGTAT